MEGSVNGSQMDHGHVWKVTQLPSFLTSSRIGLPLYVVMPSSFGQCFTGSGATWGPANMPTPVVGTITKRRHSVPHWEHLNSIGVIVSSLCGNHGLSL